MVNNILCGDRFADDITLYPCSSFFTEDDVSDKDKVIKNLSNEIFSVLSSFSDCRIQFKMAGFGEVEFPDRTRSEIYLKSIDSALRDCFSKNNTVPTVAFYLRGANIGDNQARIVTDLIHDKIVGRFDPTFKHTCLIDLRDNDLTNEAISNLAEKVTGTSVWCLYVDGNCDYTKKTLDILKDLASRNLRQLKEELPFTPDNLNLLPRQISF